MVEITPNPDSTVKHIETDSGKPTKVFYNWLQNITRIIGGFGDIVTHDASEFVPVSGAPAAFSAVHSGTQSLAANVYTSLAFDTELYDVGNFFASNAWTPPAGKVHLMGAWSADSTTFNTSNITAAAIIKNGGIRKQAFGINFGTTFGAGHVACDDICNGSDVYRLQAFVSLSSGTATARSNADQTWFMGHWISA